MCFKQNVIFCVTDDSHTGSFLNDFVSGNYKVNHNARPLGSSSLPWVCMGKSCLLLLDHLASQLIVHLRKFLFSWVLYTIVIVCFSWNLISYTIISVYVLSDNFLAYNRKQKCFNSHMITSFSPIPVLLTTICCVLFF